MALIESKDLLQVANVVFDFEFSALESLKSNYVTHNQKLYWTEVPDFIPKKVFSLIILRK